MHRLLGDGLNGKVAKAPMGVWFGKDFSDQVPAQALERLKTAAEKRIDLKDYEAFPLRPRAPHQGAGDGVWQDCVPAGGTGTLLTPPTPSPHEGAASAALNAGHGRTLLA